MNELDKIKRAVEKQERAANEFDQAVLGAYRAEREDGTPRFTLSEIGDVLGVSRQRVYQLVRKVAERSQEDASS